jgi:hypothetical protein
MSMTKVVSVKGPFRIQGKGMTISEKTHAPLYWELQAVFSTEKSI